MKRTKNRRTRITPTKSGSSSDRPLLDADSDKSGTDKNADSTVEQTGKQKFNKPKREENPDKTGIDIQTEIKK